MPRKPKAGGIENKAPETKGGNPTWVKGGPSPNPGGRPKATRELLEEFRAATPRAREVAESIMDNVALDPKLRLDAAKFIASYGLGKPPSIELDEPTDEESRPLAGLSHEKLLEIARADNGPPAAEH